MGSEVGREEEVTQAPSTPTSGPVQGGSAKPEELLAEVLSNHLLWPSILFRVGKNMCKAMWRVAAHILFWD